MCKSVHTWSSNYYRVALEVLISIVWEKIAFCIKKKSEKSDPTGFSPKKGLMNQSCKWEPVNVDMANSIAGKENPQTKKSDALNYNKDSVDPT